MLFICELHVSLVAYLTVAFYVSVDCLNYLQVFRSCYTKVSPSAEVDNPQLVAWSDSVAELLDLDPRE